MLRSRLTSVISTSTREIKRFNWKRKKTDLDGPQGWDHDAWTDLDRHMVRFKHDTAMSSHDPRTCFDTRARICGNGWMFQRRAGLNKKHYRQRVAGGEEFHTHMQRKHVSDNNLTTLAHKMSNTDYLRQRWTVADPFKGYDDEAHYWYVPDDIPIRRHRPDTAINRFELNREKFQWPIKSVSGKHIDKHERRSDTTMHDPGKPNPNHNKDSRTKFTKFCSNHNIGYNDIC